MKTIFLSIPFTIYFVLLITIAPFGTFAQRLKYGEEFPKTNDVIDISVKHDDRGNQFLPVGAYRVPNSSYIFWSPKSGAQSLGGLGGLIRLGSKSEMKETASQEAIFLTINLDSITKENLRDKLQHQTRFISSDNTNEKNNITLRPCSWVFVEGDYYEMVFEIEANYFNETGTETWKCQYAYVVPDANPLLGIGGLIENNGELLNQVARRGISHCVEAFLEDLKGSDAQWKKETNLPKELDEYPRGTLFLKLPKHCTLLMETKDNWIIKQPIQYQGSSVKIISKNKERLLLHPLGKTN